MSYLKPCGAPATFFFSNLLLPDHIPSAARRKAVAANARVAEIEMLKLGESVDSPTMIMTSDKQQKMAIKLLFQSSLRSCVHYA